MTTYKSRCRHKMPGMFSILLVIAVMAEKGRQLDLTSSVELPLLGQSSETDSWAFILSAATSIHEPTPTAIGRLTSATVLVVPSECNFRRNHDAATGQSCWVRVRLEVAQT